MPICLAKARSRVSKERIREVARDGENRQTLRRVGCQLIGTAARDEMTIRFKTGGGAVLRSRCGARNGFWVIHHGSSFRLLPETKQG
jgi:hypothetical protein